MVPVYIAGSQHSRLFAGLVVTVLTAVTGGTEVITFDSVPDDFTRATPDLVVAAPDQVLPECPWAVWGSARGEAGATGQPATPLRAAHRCTRKPEYG